ncbi:MAG: hypothetical protein HQK53_06585 [Oligoflexia bacterium]|nr:hypothetical protein [Oligoflexia bacterium]
MKKILAFLLIYTAFNSCSFAAMYDLICFKSIPYKIAYKTEKRILEISWRNSYSKDCNRLKEFLGDNDSGSDLNARTNMSCYQKGLRDAYRRVAEDLTSECKDGPARPCTEVAGFWAEITALEFCTGQCVEMVPMTPFCATNSIPTCRAVFHNLAKERGCFEFSGGPNRTKRERSRNELENAINENCNIEKFNFARKYIHPDTPSTPISTPSDPDTSPCVELGTYLGKNGAKAECTADQRRPQKPTLPFCKKYSLDTCIAAFDKVVQEEGGCFIYDLFDGIQIERSKGEVATIRQSICNGVNNGDNPGFSF